MQNFEREIEICPKLEETHVTTVSKIGTLKKVVLPALLDVRGLIQCHLQFIRSGTEVSSGLDFIKEGVIGNSYRE